MTRQYIGARYVPHFVDDPFDSSLSYQAMDVVDDGMGTSYIAKIPVPPGTSLSDRTYWALYGAASGAIVNLQNRVTALESGKDNFEQFNVSNFPGDTAEEKLHNALDYVKSNGYHSVLVCNDNVTITTAYDLYDADDPRYEDSWATVIIKGAVFDFNGVPLFTGQTGNRYTFVPTFEGCEFNANVGGYVLDGTVNINYVNPKFTNCIFYHVGLVDNSDVDNAIFVQSPTLIGCKVYYTNAPFLKTSKLWNCVVDGCQFEGSSDIGIEATRTIDGFVIVNSCFEGFYNGSPIKLDRGTLNVRIINNYFEKNRPHTIEIGSDYIYSVEISGNSFYISEDDETPIYITGNTTNANIVINDNCLIPHSDTYLANIEPISAVRYGYHNKKFYNGAQSKYVFPDRTVLGFQAGRAQEVADWAYTVNGYTCAYDFYGDIRTQAPFLFGCIRGLSELNNSTKHTMNSIFTINVIGTKDTDTNTDIYELKVVQLNAGVGRNTGTDDDVVISAVLVDDPDDTNHHTINITATCTSGYYGGTYIVGRVFNMMDVAALEMAHT